ncbi:hybrid sensor histidine kinase/response regulator [Noviherbaspirillum sp. Root189]|uniref:hybrid sensor histidine kinase/response regulator n=1 Tax=Noviherbaspirillum sp. Root189 TaxID=1736487 RepID=UPI0007090EE5|nr:PAS domain-containing sensor histidine kinase [Noviherbaspirillum sp. Root189]KRB93004.1 PAS domain-containing sensor histidine kinase [Noviherbaspirillum sp. Root189]
MNDMTTSTSQKSTDENRFQLLVSGISDYAIYMLSTEGIVTSWNAGAQRFKGYTADEIIGQHFSRFYTPEDQQTGLPAKALETALREGKFEAEGWRVRKDGTRFWTSVVIDPIYDTSGQHIGFAKVTRDITEQRRAQEALRQSEQRFRMLVQGVTDYAIYMLSPTGEVTNWNAGAERIKGYSANEVIGTSFSRFHTPEDQAAGLPAVALATAAKEGRFEREGWRMRKDGSKFWAHVIIDAIYNDDGSLAGFAKITRDITEKKNAAEALERANTALFQSQKMEAIGQLTGGIAHDFNNLLSVISSGLEVLPLKTQEPGELKIVESMKRAVDRGATLTQQLLSFARQQPLRPEKYNLNSVINGFEAVLRRAGNSTISFNLVLANGLNSVMVDAPRFETALLNLVVNARDAMPHGGQISVSTSNVTLSDQQVSGLAAGQYVKVAVSDTGSGMPPEVISRAFEPFFTTKEVGKGTGLGLSQVYGFMKQSDGGVDVESRVGHGTTINLYLPALDERSSDAAPSEDGSEKVLVVDDEPDVMEMAAALFRSIGYEVFTANNGPAALEVLERTNDISVLFSDVMMPSMSGIELAKRARRLRPDMKILLASGYPLPALKAQHSGVDEFAFINKPYKLADLAKKLRLS